MSRLKRNIFIAASIGLYLFLAQAVTGAICMIYATVGFPCPGCGLTRAFSAAFRLDFSGALRWHPLFWVIPIGIAFAVYNYLKHGSIINRAFHRFALATGICFFALYAVRLFLFFPHTEPMIINPSSILQRLLRVIFV